MEFSVKKFDLLEELTLTQGVVERKTTIPILSNLLCEAKGSRLAITATDLDRKSTRLNSSHIQKSRMPSSA